MQTKYTQTQGAELIAKDGWYVFRYDGHDCPVPRENAVIGETGTQLYVYFSSNYKHCILTEERPFFNCNGMLLFFNISYTLFGIILTVIIMTLICTFVWYPCLGPHNSSQQKNPHSGNINTNIH